MDRSPGSLSTRETGQEPPFGGNDLAEALDLELLAAMGYKQEFRRHYSTLQVFAIAFSIMGLLPSIASTLSFSVSAGPAAMVWADLGSALPTSGGLYWWTHHFAAAKWKNPLSFLVGYSNTIGLIGGICSVDYSFVLMVFAIVSFVRDGEWMASRNLIYGVYAATIVTHGVLAILAAPIMHRIQTACIVANVGLVLATVIALPIGRSRTVEGINSAAYVFGHIDNLTTWPAGWAFMLAWLSPIWSVGAFDSCIHMSEEAMNAAKAVPYGILGAIGACWSLGFVSLCIIAACMSTDPHAILESRFGQPIAQIYYDALGKNAAIGFMVTMATVQFFMGLSIVIAASRQTWAFSRDGALPFSDYLKVVSTRFRYQPARAVAGVTITSVILGLLCLINNAATNALFSLTVAGNSVAWATPIFCRIFWGQDKFKPGSFYTGRLSTPIAIIALVYLAFSITLSMFPTAGPAPSRKSSPCLLLFLFNGQYELHGRDQRMCLGWLAAVLFLISKEVVPWASENACSGITLSGTDNKEMR
ncbi:GABA-specific permease [Microsporum canis CBS 113480]|uniref:GABA-specific permease n=1 Tax=Arthroderma otae (strain ATCC MYA-4605 / CBS 113480) TaxID=554155 RepID=C5FGL7_ARTOC|nr:GABA-specific permease [Microsporum canis CBS 113480]EEQ29902.1 GABA-specific permease [Microsporum canis CBS 113480]